VPVNDVGEAEGDFVDSGMLIQHHDLVRYDASNKRHLHYMRYTSTTHHW